MPPVPFVQLAMRAEQIAAWLTGSWVTNAKNGALTTSNVTVKLIMTGQKASQMMTAATWSPRSKRWPSVTETLRITTQTA